MKILTLPVSLGLLALLPAMSRTAETGDFDGDGRLSLGDILQLQTGAPRAPGSIDAFDRSICADASHPLDDSTIAGLVFTEALRRNVPDPLPHWYGWEPFDARNPALPVDPRIRLRMAAPEAPGGDDDRVRLRLTLSTDVELWSFCLIISSQDRALRPRISYDPVEIPWFSWRRADWTSISRRGTFLMAHAEGDLTVSVSPADSLVSGGHFVIVSTNVRGVSRGEVIPPGDYEIVVDGRLPSGLNAGSYELAVLPGSEVLLQDGTLAQPQVEPPGNLRVLNEVTTGFDDEVPPLRFDQDQGQIEGQIEYRLVDAEGRPPNEDGVVAEVEAGDSLRLRVQIRTDVPLNRVPLRLRWPSGSLLCAAEAEAVERVVFERPDGASYRSEGDVVTDGRVGTSCTSGLLGTSGRFWASFVLSGGAYQQLEVANPRRVLEYFQPLGQWLDVAEVHLEVPLETPGGRRIPIHMSDVSPSFYPYSREQICESLDSFSRRLAPDLWAYDVSYAGGDVVVLRGEEPPPPPEAGVQIRFGEVAGAPGETVDIPLLAKAEEDIELLQISFAFDSGDLDLMSADFDVFSLLREESYILPVSPGGKGSTIECVDEDGDGRDDRCLEGIPWFIEFPEPTLLRVFTQPPLFGRRVDFPGGEFREIAKLRARIEADAVVGSSVKIHGVTTPWDVSEQVSGGFLVGSLEFSPAEVTPGLVTIRGPVFRRGDCNDDGERDITDAVAGLAALFLGTESPACRDACDTNDDGQFDVSDPIAGLGVVFLGQGTIPAPSGRCGVDPTVDRLGCERFVGCGG